MLENVQHDAIKEKFFMVFPEGECELSYHKVNDTTLDYYHTFVPPALRNRGLAAVLVQYALNYAKANGYTVIPTCPYVKSYLARQK